MTATLESMTLAAEKEWMAQLGGKTIKGVRPQHNNSPVPEVSVLFSDGTAYLITVKPGVYFEGCLINTLRRAQPIEKVVVLTLGTDTIIEIRTKTFPLLQLVAQSRGEAHDQPFVLTQKNQDDV